MGDALQLTLRVFDPVQCLLLLLGIHLWQSFGKLAANPMHDGRCHIEVPL
jgi:hypothetical protein